jgi:prolyl oligopeptidase
MRIATSSPPSSRADPVKETLHGVSVIDPYRWLEDQASPETRWWLRSQQEYFRSYLDGITGRETVQQRVRELLDVEQIDSIYKVGKCFVYRKRLVGHDQPGIFLREGLDGEERLLIDPASRNAGEYLSVTPLLFSSDCRLMLFELKHGGERSGTFEILEIASRRVLPDKLERGFLRGFAFGPNNAGFYYSHEPHQEQDDHRRSVRYHRLGTSPAEDREILSASGGADSRVCLLAGDRQVGILVYRFQQRVHTDFYLKPLAVEEPAQRILADLDYFFGPVLVRGKVLAITNHNAPNLCIGELRLRAEREPEWIGLIPESDCRIQQWLVTDDRIFVRYVRGPETQLYAFDHQGQPAGEVEMAKGEASGW